MSNKLVFQRRTAAGLQTVGEYFAAYEKRNMLDNWDFTNPVNQRGATTYLDTTKQIPTIDRWKAGKEMKVEVLSDSVKLTGTGAPLSVFRQFFEGMDASRLAGRTVTISLDVAACTGNFSCYFLYGSPSTSLTSGILVSTGIQGIRTTTIVLPNASAVNGNLQFVICCSEGNGASLTLRSAMVEVGDESTLGQSAPMDYNQELSRCRRHCTVIDVNERARMVSYGNNYFDAVFPLTRGLRVAPSIELGEIALCTLAGAENTSASISNISVIAYKTGLWLRATTAAAHGMTDGFMKVKSQMIVSADV